MEEFQQRALAEANDPPRWWIIYIDDTYTVLKKDQAEAFMDQYLNFNSKHPLEHQRGVVRTLTHRATSIVSDLRERKKVRSCKNSTGIQRIPRLDVGRD